MSCIGSSIPSLDAFMASVERCALEYGGSNWQSMAMIGAATVLVVGLAVATVILLVQGLRR